MDRDIDVHQSVVGWVESVCRRRGAFAVLQAMAMLLLLVTGLSAAESPATSTPAGASPGATTEPAVAEEAKAQRELEAARMKLTTAQEDYARMKEAYPKGAPTAVLFQVATRLETAKAEYLRTLNKYKMPQPDAFGPQPVNISGVTLPEDATEKRIKQLTEYGTDLRAQEQAMKEAEAGYAALNARKPNVSEADLRDGEMKVAISRARVAALTAQYHKALTDLNGSDGGGKAGGQATSMPADGK